MKLLPFLLFVSIISSAQHGTIILGAICRDGIFIGSDSRACWFGNKKQVSAYYDRTLKIFQNKDFILTMAGTQSFVESNLTFFGFFEKFKESNPKNISLSNFYDKITEFASHILTKKDSVILSKNVFIIGTIELKQAKIFYRKDGKNEVITEGLRCNLIDNPQPANILKIGSDLKFETFDQATHYLKDFMERLIIYIYNPFSEVGGKVYKATIDIKNKLIIKDNIPYGGYKTVKEQFVAIINGKETMHYRTSDDSVLHRKMAMDYVLKH